MNRFRRDRQLCVRWHRRRRGWTLVEALVSITIGALVFAAAVKLLGFAMHADSGGGRAAEGLQSLDRLAEQFRADVRSAIDVHLTSPVKAATNWTMNLPDNRRIDYILQDHALLRTAYRADTIVDRDAFALGDETTVRLELRPKEQPTNAALVLERTADGAPPSVDNMRITVPIGWDRRFVESGKNQKTE